MRIEEIEGQTHIILESKIDKKGMLSIIYGQQSDSVVEASQMFDNAMKIAAYLGKMVKL